MRDAWLRPRRRGIGAAAIGAAAVVSAGACVIAAYGASPANRTTSAGGVSRVAGRCPPGDLGTVAFVRGGALDLLDLHGCSERTLVRAHAFGPVQFSFDGRYVAFHGGFVSTRSGRVTATVGTGMWSPTSDVLVAATKNNGLVLLAPGGATRRLLPDGWGVLTFAFSPNGRTIAVSRSHYGGPSVPSSKWHQEIWLISVATGSRRMIFKLKPPALAPAWLQGFSPDGRWLLFWEDTQNSASLAADGLPLVALPLAGGHPVKITGELHASDFLTWCGTSLVYVINHGGREVTLGDGLAMAKPPRWRSQTVLPLEGKTSWNSVACPTASAAARGGGGLVVAGGPTSGDSPFGHEHRSLWMVAPQPAAKPRRLYQTVPPKGETDELPMWSGDGRWILFVRTTPGGSAARGELYAIDPFGGNLVGPIANLGTTGNYYGAYSWPYQLDWHR